MGKFKIINNLLIPPMNFEFDGLLTGFTLPFYGNMALTRKSVLTGLTTAENRENLARELSIDINRFFSPHQIHSDKIVYVDEKNVGYGAIELDKAVKGDACITDKKGILLLVTWADCIPVLLYDNKKEIIAAIHAGWKGINSQIIEKTISRMLDMGSKACDIYISIGPGIRNCCYKVGSEFEAYFKNYKDLFRYDNNYIYFDLAGCANKKIVEAGINPGSMEFYGKCTSCNNTPVFFSCRRQGKDYFEGQAAFICMR